MEQLTRPCFDCGKEQAVTEDQYNRRNWLVMCTACRVKWARLSAGEKVEKQ